jgi:hypothetical protein
MQKAKRRVKQIGETKDKTYGETSNETCKEKMKSVSDLRVISAVRGEL